MADRLPLRPGYKHRGAGRLGDSRSMAGQPLDTPSDEAAPHWRTVWRRFRKHRLAVVSLATFTLIALCAVFADWIAPHGATEQHLDQILVPPGRDFWLGSDTLGRDTLSRILYGGRISLLVGVAVSLISGVVGTTVGLVAGYCRRWVDAALMRFTDTMLALPALMVVIMAARVLGDSVLDVVVVLAAVTWMVPARIVRAKVLSLCENQFVEAAVALGVPARRIMVRDLLPNVVGEIVVAVSLTVAGAILAESTLSFLGLGVSAAHTATWGNMLGGNEGFMITAPWLVWAPGLAIVVTVLCINFIGDGLRDAIDPPRR